MRGSNGTLYAGVAVGALILAALAWLLGVSPRLTRAADANESRVAQEDFNFNLNLTLQKLITEAAMIPEYQAQIYDIRDDLPPYVDIPGFRRTLDQIFVENDLILLSDSIGTGTAMSPQVSLKAAADAVGLKSPIEGLQFNSLVGTSVNIQFGGAVEDALNVVNELQYGDHRYFLITAMSIAAVTEQTETAGVDLQPGDITVELTGYIFTLDYGKTDIQVRPAEPEVPTCIEPPEEPAAGEPAAEGEEPAVEATDPEAPPGDLPFCEVDNKPGDFNPFVPLP